MATTEERLARIEGGYEHMATKADIAATKAEIAVLNEKVDAMSSELRLTGGRLASLSWPNLLFSVGGDSRSIPLGGPKQAQGDSEE